MAYKNTNAMPKHEDGTVLHLGVKSGQVANRIVSVGSLGRAELLAQLLDDAQFETYESSRGFTTFTGAMNGVPLSIVATGMTRAIVEGSMAIVRFGTCGGVRADVAPGSVVVSGKGSLMVTRNPDAFFPDSDGEEPYRVSRVMPASPALSKTVSERQLLSGSPQPAYSRLDSAFDDRNEQLMANLTKSHPELHTLEMETFHLLDLAQRSRGSIQATAAVLVVANRPTGQVVEADVLKALEGFWGRVILETLAAAPLQ
ncbi:hypothetical protein BBJ28_00017192 [Nothophytophthora sp. Chile5]|nr:hypothetical protein BBJ28_00017192 [Nothophytophthora sp. Chile5]